MKYQVARLFGKRGEDILEITEDMLAECDIKGIGVRGWGEFMGRAFYLPMDKDWMVKVDRDGAQILIPLKKGVL